MQIQGFTELIKHWKLQCGEKEWLDGKNDLDKGYVEKKCDFVISLYFYFTIVKFP